MNKIDSKPAKELRDLEKMNPSDIDLSDLPEVRDWNGAAVGKFYRPIKKPLTLRIDAEVIEDYSCPHAFLGSSRVRGYHHFPQAL